MRSLPAVLLLTVSAASPQSGVVVTPFGTQTVGVNGGVASQARTPAQRSAQPRIQEPTRFDCAADGVVQNAITGAGVLRARVTLNAGSSSTTVLTDGTGRFSFTAAPCGSVRIGASRTGFVNNFGQIRPGQPAPPLLLDPSSPAHDITLKLVPQAVMTGKVLDEFGDPLQGAQVQAFTSFVMQGRRSLRPSGGQNTNDLGEFRFSGLAPGNYVFCAQWNAPGVPMAATSLHYGESCYPGPTDGGTFEELRAGVESKVDFNLRQVPAVHVRGTISGLPESNRGVGVSLAKRGSDGALGSRRGAAILDGGRFDIPAVEPGSYLLMADHFETGKHLALRVPIEVGSSDLDGVAATLESGVAISGNIRIESQSGTVAPNQFMVGLIPSENFYGTGRIDWSQDKSSFTIADVIPGTYRLNLTPPPGFYLKSASSGGQDILSGGLTVAAAAQIDIVIADNGGAIEGDLLDDQGQAATGWLLLTSRTTRERLVPTPGSHFKLPDLAPGDYTIYAWDDIQQVEYADPDWMHLHAGSGTNVSVTAGQTSQVRLVRQIAPTP